MKKNPLADIDFLIVFVIVILMMMLSGLFPTGCASPPATVAYQTIFDLETTTTAAFDGYLMGVAKGQISTNSVPQISKAFNLFQTDAAALLEAAQFSTNTIAPSGLITEAANVANAILSAKGAK